MDLPYEVALNGGWDGWLDSWILASLAIAALPVVVVIVLAVIAASTEPRTVRRRFWCALQRREAEVNFTARALLSTPCSVVSCSIFEPGSAVACRRRCVDASYRRQWAPPLAAWRGENP